MATLMLTKDGDTLANLDQMFDIHIRLENSGRSVIVGRGHGAAVEMFVGTHDECLEQIRRVANVMNAEGHTVIDQGSGRVHRPESPLGEAAAKRLEGVPLLDPEGIPDHIHPEAR